MTEPGRHIAFQYTRFRRLEEIGLDQVVKVADVGRQDQVGGAVGAFGLEPFQHAFLQIHHVDLDSGLLGEGVEQRVHEERLAIRIKIDLGRRGAGCHGRQARCGAEDHGRENYFEIHQV